MTQAPHGRTPEDGTPCNGKGHIKTWWGNQAHHSKFLCKVGLESEGRKSWLSPRYVTPCRNQDWNLEPARVIVFVFVFVHKQIHGEIHFQNMFSTELDSNMMIFATQFFLFKNFTGFFVLLCSLRASLSFSPLFSSLSWNGIWNSRRG